MRKFFTVTVVAFALGLSTQAAALDLPLIDLRVGLRGGLNVNLLPDVGEDDPIPVYPGFAGLGWHFGGAIGFDYLGIVGIEIGVSYSSEVASGTAEFDRDLGSDNIKEETDFRLEASAIHVPLFIRGQIPLGVVSPYLSLGMDFVVSRSDHALVLEQRGDAPAFIDGCSPGVDCDPFPQRDYDVMGIDSTTNFLLGIGLDIDVTAVTIPIEFRALINPNFGNSIVDRTTNTGGTPAFLYNNEWQYQIFAIVGVNYRIF